MQRTIARSRVRCLPTLPACSTSAFTSVGVRYSRVRTDALLGRPGGTLRFLRFRARLRRLAISMICPTVLPSTVCKIVQLHNDSMRGRGGLLWSRKSLKNAESNQICVIRKLRFLPNENNCSQTWYDHHNCYRICAQMLSIKDIEPIYSYRTISRQLEINPRPASHLYGDSNTY